METKLSWQVVVFLLVFIISVYFIGMSVGLRQQRRVLIKDPLIVYANYKVEPLNLTGVVGVISQEDFRKFLNYTDPVIEKFLSK